MKIEDYKKIHDPASANMSTLMFVTKEELHENHIFKLPGLHQQMGYTFLCANDNEDILFEKLYNAEGCCDYYMIIVTVNAVKLRQIQLEDEFLNKYIDGFMKAFIDKGIDGEIIKNELESHLEVTDIFELNFKSPKEDANDCMSAWSI